MSVTVTDQVPDATTVAAYLRAHPRFLDDYPELALQLTMQPPTGPVASLAAYQLQNLREKNVQLEGRLAELVKVAAENESLMRRVHALTVALLRANTLEVTLRTIFAGLSADFHSELIRLLMFGRQADLPRGDWLVQIPGSIEALPEFAGILDSGEPLCGRLSDERRSRLFAEHADQVQSAAVMRLGEAGVLAIGSARADRFQPGMGTLFLSMIASTITAALARSHDVA